MYRIIGQYDSIHQMAQSFGFWSGGLIIKVSDKN